MTSVKQRSYQKKRSSRKFFINDGDEVEQAKLKEQLKRAEAEIAVGAAHKKSNRDRRNWVRNKRENLKENECILFRDYVSW